MRSSTETIARALRILAATIDAPDDVPRMALEEAAERLEELEAKATAEPAALPLGFLSDVLTAAGLVEHGRQSKGLAERLGAAVMEIRSARIPKSQTGREVELEAEVERLRDRLEYARNYVQSLVDHGESVHAAGLVRELDSALAGKEAQS